MPPREEGRSAPSSRSGPCLLLALLAVAPAAARGEGAGSQDLTVLSLEELSNLEVTSVSRKEEPLADAAAAIAVVTNEAIRRSGATTIPEALRLVPGLHVAQIGSSLWVVSSRGFSSANSANLLVLSDSRSIYTPLFSGVFWDVQDQMLEDVEHIEVIRGPGASLWGANAVNGVINITTKSAKETQGAYFEGGGGTIERGFGAVRYGGTLGEGAYFRVFAKGFSRAGEFNPLGDASDAWKMGHMGLRADWEIDRADTLTVQGDAYTGDVGQVMPSVEITGRPGPTGKLVAAVAGGNLLARWARSLGPGSELQVRAYYDSTHRDDPAYIDDLQTVDLDLQHRFQLPLRQEIVWGLGFRSMSDRLLGKGPIALQPPDSRDDLFSGFVQDQLAVLDSLHVTLGTKLEHNGFSGFEVQPTARVAWNPFRGHTVWGAVSRAVRVPTRLERDVFADVTDPAQSPVIRLLGSKDFSSERVLAYELGYRWQLEPVVFVDLAAHYDVYSGLASLELNPLFTDPRTGQVVIPIVDKNLTDGVARGVEASVTVSPARGWRLVANYTFTRLTLEPRGQDLNRGRLIADATPRNQIGIQSFFDLPARFQLDLFLRYATSLPSSAQLFQGQETPAYATLDARLGWRAGHGLELSLVGRSLFQDHHREFPGGTEVERAVFVKVAGRY